MISALLACVLAALVTGCTATPQPDTRSTARTAAPTTSPKTATPSPSVELGVVQTRDAPLDTATFLAQNHWAGYVDGVYTAVFAGLDRHSRLGARPDAAVAVFQYPGPDEIGIFHSDTGTTPLAIDSENDDTLRLSDGSPRGVTFSLFTHAFTAVSAPTAHGCSRTRTHVPTGAVAAPIADVDGDGRPDREWAAQTSGGVLTLGVETASHAVLSLTEDFAGGAPRSGFVTRLAHNTVAVASEQRDAELFTLVGCHFVPTATTSRGQHFYLSIDTQISGNFAPDTGTGTTCSHGQLYALQAVGQTRARIVRTPLTVGSDGTRVTLGTPTVVVPHPTQQQTADAYALSCGTIPVLHPPVPHS